MSKVQLLVVGDDPQAVSEVAKTVTGALKGMFGGDDPEDDEIDLELLELHPEQIAFPHGLPGIPLVLR